MLSKIEVFSIDFRVYKTPILTQKRPANKKGINRTMRDSSHYMPILYLLPVLSDKKYLTIFFEFHVLNLSTFSYFSS